MHKLFLEPILLSTAYLPPVQYMSKFLTGGSVIIETHENYQKQSYRNRSCIYGANGRQCLVIPVIKTHGEKTPISLVEIDHKAPWRKIHLKSIHSAYKLSPFYEFYADEFNGLFDERVSLILDWNTRFLKYILRLLELPAEIKSTAVYEKFPDHTTDLRQSIHPKTRLIKPDERFNPVPYNQVFGERYGFIPNLSIIDLLFNEGPNTREVMAGCIC
jgi:hypothetical protein